MALKMENLAKTFTQFEEERGPFLSAAQSQSTNETSSEAMLEEVVPDLRDIRIDNDESKGFNVGCEQSPIDIIIKKIQAKHPMFKIKHDVTTPPKAKRVGKFAGEYSRKEKSLGELSKRFLFMFGRAEDCMISLDVITTELKVERRRIYDIINILESLGVVSRKGKNNYLWKGLTCIYASLEKFLKVKEGDTTQLQEEQQTGRRARTKKEKSLGILSTGFIRLFVGWRDVISLEQAARRLSTNTSNLEENKIKTKIRRLYDIANVFSALGLIKKTSLESRKPAFRWVGASGLEAFIVRLNTARTEQELFPPRTSRKMAKLAAKQLQQTVNSVSAIPCVVRQTSFKSNNSAFKVSEVSMQRESSPTYQETVRKFVSYMFSQFCNTVFTKPPVEESGRGEDIFMRTLNKNYGVNSFPI
eukprot:TRINITY_DN1562_c0_g3_i3.p1 TRINITY_DN1562_c0_g3~~TRINITY_DN1562_c0_g3_i3.p1  ORF type:complete len:416 (-),score=102.16 TRINITY_DN1562_c0_g3_i3:826-2073(-)